jgi:hypothetical protein
MYEGVPRDPLQQVDAEIIHEASVMNADRLARLVGRLFFARLVAIADAVTSPSRRL